MSKSDGPLPPALHRTFWLPSDALRPLPRPAAGQARGRFLRCPGLPAGAFSAKLAAVAVAVALTWAACSNKQAETGPVVTVQVATVQRGAIERVVSTEAVLFASNQAVITPKITAPVRKFYVNRGSHVHQGQLLATLESRDLQAAATDSRGGLDQAEAAYESAMRSSLPEEMEKAELDAKAAREALDVEQKAYESRKRLYDQGALARKDLDQSAVSLIQARNQYEIAQKHLQALRAVGREQEIKSAKGQLIAAKGKYEGAEAQLAYSEIRSPIAGVVTDRPLYPGEMATAGSPLITVMDASQVVARAHVAQEEATLLRPGNPATLSAPGLEGDDVAGRVTMVSSALDPNSTTVEVWIQVRNPEGRLKPGSTVTLSVVAQKVPNALVIPAAAVLTAEDGSTNVMLVGSDGKAHQRSVKTGIRQGNQIQITDGLQEGDRLVTVGAYGLPDGTAVQIESPGEKGEQPGPKQGEKDKD